MLRTNIPRHRGSLIPSLSGPAFFTVDAYTFSINPDVPIIKRSTIKKALHSVEEDFARMRAAGKVITSSSDFHNGLFVFSFPNGGIAIATILMEVFSEATLN